ncbi:MAG: hypothetical protein FWC78_07430 [Defluviitaleaceae bacterium]|nr:hypothetical protein [Defluviitaleaceae bacterium]
MDATMKKIIALVVIAAIIAAIVTLLFHRNSLERRIIGQWALVGFRMDGEFIEWEPFDNVNYSMVEISENGMVVMAAGLFTQIGYWDVTGGYWRFRTWQMPDQDWDNLLASHGDSFTQVRIRGGRLYIGNDYAYSVYRRVKSRRELDRLSSLHGEWELVSEQLFGQWRNISPAQTIEFLPDGSSVGPTHSHAPHTWPTPFDYRLTGSYLLIIFHNDGWQSSYAYYRRVAG